MAAVRLNMATDHLVGISLENAHANGIAVIFQPANSYLFQEFSG
jgi:hypothetical protein